MPCDKRKLEAALMKKGFKYESGDHNFLRFYYNGKKTSIGTKTSHGSDKEITDSLMSFMAKQVGLTNPQFKLYVKCDISEQNFIEIVTMSGRLRP